MKKPVRHLLVLGFALVAVPAIAGLSSTLEFRLVVDCGSGDADGGPMRLAISRENLCVSRQIIAAGPDLAAVTVGKDRIGLEVIELVLRDRAAERMHTVTASHARGRIGMILNGELISAPFIFEPLSREVDITLNQEGEKLREIAAAIRSTMANP